MYSLEHICVCCTGLAAYIAYSYFQLAELQVVKPTFAIYDSDNDALARPFLLKRFEGAASNSTSLPGGQSRWRLPEDSSGVRLHSRLPIHSTTRFVASIFWIGL